VDKKLKIDCVPLKASKLLPLVVKQGRFLIVALRQFYSRFLSKAERGSIPNEDSLMSIRIYLRLSNKFTISLNFNITGALSQTPLTFLS